MKKTLRPLICVFGLLAALTSPLAALSKDANDKAVMNFVDADIVSVITAIGQYSDITFIIDPRVKGTVSLVSEKPLSKAKALAMLASVLRVQGYAVVQGDGFMKVVPETDAKQQLALSRSGAAHGDQITTRIFTLDYASAASLVPVLRPLISPNNTINVSAGNNALVITDYAENLEHIAAMIAVLDKPAVDSFDVVQVHYGIASDIAAMVNKLLESSPGAPYGSTDHTVILSDPRTNSVIIHAPSPGRTNFAKALIIKLDQPTAQAGNMHVVYLKNADAVHLAATLRAIVAEDASVTGALPPNTLQPSSTLQSASSSSDSTDTNSAANTASTKNAPSPPGSAANSSAISPFAQMAAHSNSGFIQADAATNTLIITASEPVYRNLRNVIDQLDTRRAQVYVEALIVEVTDSASAQLGVQWLAASGNSESNYRVAGGTSFGSNGDNIVNQALAIRGDATTAPTILPPSNGLTIGILRQVAGKIGLNALATALDGKQGSNVLSMPNLLTLDNEEASISVGQNVPFITGSYLPNTGGSSTNPFQTIERKDVGVALRVRPHVSEGGTVRLEISQEVSSVDPTSVGSSTGLITNKRSLDTDVVMDDGQVIVLGGLIGYNKSSSIQKVPLLGDIPGLGYLFKFQDNSRQKTNLMIFLKPTIIRNREQSSVIVADRYDYMRQGQIKAEDTLQIFKDPDALIVPPLQQGGPFTHTAPPSQSDTVPAPSEHDSEHEPQGEQ